MVRIARDKRHALLQKRIEDNPFINDEELAEELSSGVIADFCLSSQPQLIKKSFNHETQSQSE